MATKAIQQKRNVIRASIEEARANPTALIEHVRGGDRYVVLESDGEPAAVLMDVDEFEDYLELQDPEVIRAIAEGRKEYLEGKSFPAEDLIDELKAEARKRQRETEPEKA